MRRAIHALLAGSLAFGLIAAAASSATFGLTLQDIVRAGTSEASAELVVGYAGCEGAYHIEWVFEDDVIIGFSATRTIEDPDETLVYCANQPFQLLVSAFLDEETRAALVPVSTVEDETDDNGDIAATFLDPLDAGDRDEIVLLIGPEAATYYG